MKNDTVRGMTAIGFVAGLVGVCYGVATGDVVIAGVSGAGLVVSKVGDEYINYKSHL